MPNRDASFDDLSSAAYERKTMFRSAVRARAVAQRFTSKGKAVAAAAVTGGIAATMWSSPIQCKETRIVQERSTSWLGGWGGEKLQRVAKDYDLRFVVIAAPGMEVKLSASSFPWPDVCALGNGGAARGE